jgi:hypothetical protein
MERPAALQLEKKSHENFVTFLNCCDCLGCERDSVPARTRFPALKHSRIPQRFANR